MATEVFWTVVVTGKQMVTSEQIDWAPRADGLPGPVTASRSCTHASHDVVEALNETLPTMATGEFRNCIDQSRLTLMWKVERPLCPFDSSGLTFTHSAPHIGANSLEDWLLTMPMGT